MIVMDSFSLHFWYQVYILFLPQNCYRCLSICQLRGHMLIKHFQMKNKLDKAATFNGNDHKHNNSQKAQDISYLAFYLVYEFTN